MFETYRLMTPATAQEFVNALEAMEWKTGLARTKEATGTIKRNQEIKAEHGNAAAVLVGQVLKRLAESSIYTDHAVTKAFPPKFNRYTDTGEYKRHGDSAVMGQAVRTDLACTIFLSHPDTYKGGDLCVETPDGGHNTVKGLPGTCVVYPCHMPHWVEPVTDGARISCITWFQSAYRDIEQRHLMRRLLRVVREMEADPDQKYREWHTSLGTIHGRLQRMWLDYEMPRSQPKIVQQTGPDAE